MSCDLPFRERASQLLSRLEIAECDCPLPKRCTCDGPCECPPDLFPGPCHHVKAFAARFLAAPFPLSFDEWRDLMRLVNPDEYAEPPSALAPAEALTRQGRVAVMALRDGWRDGKSAHQTGLYHPRDLWRAQPKDDGIQAGPEAHRGSNGAKDVTERMSSRWEEEEPPFDVEEAAGAGIVARRWREMKAREAAERLLQQGVA